MEDFYCAEIISGKTEVDAVFETDLVMAFNHTNPYFEAHVVIIPKAHIESLIEYPNSTDLNHDIFNALTYVSNLFVQKYGGCRISSNVGSYQTTKHLHWYVHYGNRLRTESGQELKG